ncbi:MAG: hypothetical protein U0836_26695 [Pirellulales bacterium]
MPHQLRRSVVRESLVLVTAAAVVMAILAHFRLKWPAILLVTGPTAGIMLLRRWWRASHFATLVGAALGAAVMLGLSGFVYGLLLPPPPHGTASDLVHGLAIALFVGSLGFVLGLPIGAIYGIVAGLAMEVLGCRPNWQDDDEALNAPAE